MPAGDRPDEAIPFYVRGVEFTHRDHNTAFEAMLAHCRLESNPALARLGWIINGTDTDNRLYQHPEGSGPRAISEGYRAAHPGDDKAMCRP